MNHKPYKSRTYNGPVCKLKEVESAGCSIFCCKWIDVEPGRTSQCPVCGDLFEMQERGAVMTFRNWMREVNATVWSVAQLDVLDLPDYAFRDAFDAGESPQDVARDLLEENGFDLDDYE